MELQFQEHKANNVFATQMLNKLGHLQKPPEGEALELNNLAWDIYMNNIYLEKIYGQKATQQETQLDTYEPDLHFTDILKQILL